MNSNKLRISTVQLIALDMESPQAKRKLTYIHLNAPVIVIAQYLAKRNNPSDSQVLLQGTCYRKYKMISASVFQFAVIILWIASIIHVLVSTKVSSENRLLWALLCFIIPFFPYLFFLMTFNRNKN